jgi:hypothetical protein
MYCKLYAKFFFYKIILLRLFLSEKHITIFDNV